jgi:hypothetical protein
MDAHTSGYVVVAGDVNGRTGSASETAAAEVEGGVLQLIQPAARASKDAELNAQGRALLRFCGEVGLWIGNGRLPGDTPGEWTFHSLARADATSIVDYFLLDHDLMAMPGKSMHVHQPALLMDHSAVELVLPVQGCAPAEPPAADGLGPSPAGPEYKVSAAVTEVFTGEAEARTCEWGVVTALGEQAQDAASLTVAVEEFDRLVGECARAAGMRPTQVGKGRGWTKRAERPPGSAALRRRRRRALSRGDRALAAALNRQACAEVRKHKRQQRRARTQRLLEMRKTDPARFAQELRGKQAGAAESITPGEWVEHYVELLDGTDEGTGEAQPRVTATIESGTPAVTAVDEREEVQQARARMRQPFSGAELEDRVRRLKNGKSVLGALKPTMLKRALPFLAAPLLALLNACVRVGQLPRTWAVSALVPIRKPGADCLTPAGYRGIALGTLPAKLFGGMLADRFTDYTEKAGKRAVGQAGFRPGYGCPEQILTLRAIIERQRAQGKRLYVCYVDFKQAFDRVPRQLLWEKLQKVGIDGWALRAVQTLYADVPMCVKTQVGYTRGFNTRMGVKQGCPLSPILFGLYLDDFEAGLMEEVGAQAAALPCWASGEPLPPLFYADDQALLSTAPEGLTLQLRYLAGYCAKWGLTVNTKKTKVCIYAAAAPRTAPEFEFEGETVERVPTFRYLGVQLHATHAFCAAASARAAAGKQAAGLLRRRMGECGLSDCPLVALELFDTYVRPVMSYGAEVWAPQLVLQALQGGKGGADACERVHLDFLRRLLGVRDTTSSLLVLSETGRLPMAVQWARHVARFTSKLLAVDETRLAKKALIDSMELAASGAAAGRGRQCWAAEAGEILWLLGGPKLCPDLLPDSIDDEQIAQVAARRHFARYDGGSAMVARYQEHILGAPVAEDTYIAASYVSTVPRRRRRVLARARTGCTDWLAEDTGRTQGIDRTARGCPHCGAALQSLQHALLECPLYDDLRSEFSDLFLPNMSLAQLLGGESQVRVSSFVEQCRVFSLERLVEEH